MDEDANSKQKGTSKTSFELLMDEIAKRNAAATSTTVLQQQLSHLQSQLYTVHEQLRQATQNSQREKARADKAEQDLEAHGDEHDSNIDDLNARHKTELRREQQKTKAERDEKESAERLSNYYRDLAEKAKKEIEDVKGKADEDICKALEALRQSGIAEKRKAGEDGVRGQGKKMKL